MSLRSLAVISALWLPVLGLSCARMGPPPGGPVDTEPPRVAGVVPAPDSTGVGTDAEIEIVFSEKVNKQDAERLVKLSPPAGRLYFRWKGARVHVRPEPGFRREMTYRLRLEPGLTDLHRVKNDSAFTSYFATGRHFSPGRIEGTVSCRDTLTDGALLYAAAAGDTALVFETASDSAGHYFFPYLPYGQYLLSAFRDRNRNGRYDYTREEGADSLADLIFDPLKINFRLELGDTTAPFPGSVSTPDSLTVELVFDDMLDSLRGISEAVIELRTPDSLGREMAVDSVRLDSLDRRKVLLYLGEPLAAGLSYFVRAREVLNTAGLSPLPGRDSRVFRYEPSQLKEKPSPARRQK